VHGHILDREITREGGRGAVARATRLRCKAASHARALRPAPSRCSLRSRGPPRPPPRRLALLAAARDWSSDAALNCSHERRTSRNPSHRRERVAVRLLGSLPQNFPRFLWILPRRPTGNEHLRSTHGRGEESQVESQAQGERSGTMGGLGGARSLRARSRQRERPA
jgi:hypothetical protein